MTTVREQMLDAIKEAGDDPADVLCSYREVVDSEGYVDSWDKSLPRHDNVPATDLPEREYDDGYGGVDGEPVIGFSERYVYVKACYDGSEWVQAVPRSMEFVTDDIPVVGGG